MSEMNKDAPEILVVLLNSMVQFADVRLIQKTQNFFLELPAPFAGNDFDEIDFLVERFLHNLIEFGIDRAAAIIDVV